MKLKTLLVLLVVGAVLAFCSEPCPAAEDEYHLGIFVNATKELNETNSLKAHLGWPNFIGSQLPYSYLGLEHAFSKYFTLEPMIGYGFEKDEDYSGIVYAIAPIFMYEKFTLDSDIEYWSGLDCLFFTTSGIYSFEKFSLAANFDIFHYFPEELEISRTYRFGPSIIIPFGEHFIMSMRYYYETRDYSNSGEHFNVFKTVFKLNF